MLPGFAVVCFLICIFNGSPAPYINPGLDVSEALSMASFFLLLSEYAASEGDLDSVIADGKSDIPSGESGMWYQVRVI